MAAFYRAVLADFRNQSLEEILGALLSSYQHVELKRRQTKAWKVEIAVLKSATTEMISSAPRAAQWSLLLEYPIPRRQKRIDAVLLAEDVIFCLEFKTEDDVQRLPPQRQVEDYAMDLRDFHEASNGRRIVPVVVVPKAPGKENSGERTDSDPVRKVKLANAADIATVILVTFNSEHRPNTEIIDPAAWDRSPYRPVLSIIEAAEALFAGHDVREIAHSHAGATNLTETSERLVQIIRTAQQRSEKVVCFVTGIPGAGKTLVGLNIVHNPALRQEGRPAGVFLSGNGPLVKIVRAAIARDYKRRLSLTGGERTTGTFIQNVDAFVRKEMEEATKPPAEKIVVFDEAQRAWDADQNWKKNEQEMSEPEAMLKIMDRHTDWAVLVALVGGDKKSTVEKPDWQSGEKHFARSSLGGRWLCRRRHW